MTNAETLLRILLLIRISLEYACIYTFINADVISTINEEWDTGKPSYY